MNSFLQFELWKDCNNKCLFCFNDNSCTTDTYKLNRLNFVLNELENPYSGIDTIGFIGGEFFDGQMKSQELMDKFISVVNKALCKPEVKRVLITTSLLFLDTRCFTYIFTNLCNLDKVTICTSWDTKYRFNKPWSNLLWEKNIFWVKNNFPNMSIHVEIIPTQYHIDSVLNNEFNIIDFENKYGVRVDYTDVNSGFKYNNKYDFQKDVPGFFPRRKDFLKFLNKVYRDGSLTPDRFLNFNNMSTLLWMELNGVYTLIKGYRGPIDGETVDPEYPLPPMHEDKSDYIDSHVRMRKDILDLWENIYE